MKKIIITFFYLFYFIYSFGQNLYPEKFEGCHLSEFCLDCGSTKALPSGDFENEFLRKLSPKLVKKISGEITLQILIDKYGNPCLLSAKNESNIKLKHLKIKDAIQNSSKWTPAIDSKIPCNTSVSLKFIFNKKSISIQRVVLDFSKKTNQSSVGVPKIRGTNESALSESWTVYNQKNSDLPWDMSRAACLDNDNHLWFGTDNGIVQLIDNKMKIINYNNSDLLPDEYDKYKTSSIRFSAVDKENNKWFIGGWKVYKYKDNTWTIYDSLNSPLTWIRKIHVDQLNNVWFTSWNGVIKFDGKIWTKINISNSKLPSNKILGIFVDSKNRVWIGTFNGNIRIYKETTTTFSNTDSPLSKGHISKVIEDSKGNFWFSLYNSDNSSKKIVVLKTNGKWDWISPKDTKIFEENNINDFLLDEEKNILWIALNSVGLIKYDIEKNSWETYTPKNSKIPSIHVMQLTKDSDGLIWAATSAGLIKQHK